MGAHRINLDIDVVLEWLLDRGFVEHTESAIHPYRIAVNEDDSMPFTITFLTKKLSERFSKTKLIATHRKVWRRELLKCFDEFQIQYDDKGTRGSMYWEFKDTTKKFLEQKLGIDMDALHEYDRTHRHNGGMRYTSYFNQAKGRYGLERALEKFRRYYERRMEELSVDLRTKRLPNSEYDK